MSYYQLLRLIIRGWWRNKLFTVVAWGSLVIGILCVSLLGAFVLHEYRADKVIPDGERILRLTQQVSMGEQAAGCAANRVCFSRNRNFYPCVET